MGRDGCGCSAPIRPHPALPARHAGPGRESPFCSLPRPLRRGREMPSAVNHPTPLSSPPQRFVRPSPCQLPRCRGPGHCNGSPAPRSVPAVGPGGCRRTCAVPAPKSVRGRICFSKPSPDPALPHPRGASPTTGKFSRDSRCFGTSLGISGYGASAVLTGPVLVPGVAADGLQQKAVVGHGWQAGDEVRPPWPSGDAALATGTIPQQDPPDPSPTERSLPPGSAPRCSLPLLPSAGEGVSLRISKLNVCPSKGEGSPAGPAGDGGEGESGWSWRRPHGAAPWPGTPYCVSCG